MCLSEALSFFLIVLWCYSTLYITTQVKTWSDRSSPPEKWPTPGFCLQLCGFRGLSLWSVVPSSTACSRCPGKGLVTDEQKMSVKLNRQSPTMLPCDRTAAHTHWLHSGLQETLRTGVCDIRFNQTQSDYFKVQILWPKPDRNRTKTPTECNMPESTSAVFSHLYSSLHPNRPSTWVLPACQGCRWSGVRHKEEHAKKMLPCFPPRPPPIPEPFGPQGMD